MTADIGPRVERALIGVALTAVLASSVALLPGCTRTAGPTTPKPTMIVLAERNRFVWLSEDADDQPAMAEKLWSPIERAESVTARSVATDTVNTVMRTGALAGLYFRQGLASLPEKPVGVLVVIEAGEAKDVSAGDVVYQRAGGGYRAVRRLPADALAEVRAAAFHRMGLE